MSLDSSNPELLSKFRGCMTGSLIGDCLGSPFEFRYQLPKEVADFISKLLTRGAVRTMFKYTDDTCMSLSIARSLIKKEKVDPKDMVERFVDEFFREPNRGYAADIMSLLISFKETNFKDVFKPARMRFDGSGSYGNGAAMRVAPMVLFDHNKTDESLQKDVEISSHITHTHHHGYNGAILQSLAIKAALNCDSSKEFDPVDFISHLETKMETVEKKDDSPYCESLKKIKEIYSQDKDISADEIAECLGNLVPAPKSVPTAIYSFLRGMKPFPKYECPNPFARTIYFAISVGGDTDTIAGMAGAIAGAYYGIEGIPIELQERCECKDEVDDLAKKLYGASQERPSCILG